MNVRRTAILVSLAVVPVALAAVPTPIRADDAPKTHQVSMRMRRSAGDVVTITRHEQNEERVLKVVDGKAVEEAGFGVTQSRTDYVAVVRCIEADADGYVTKAQAYFATYARKKGETSDNELFGIQVQIDGKLTARTITLLTPGKTLSDASRTWLDQNLGAYFRFDTLFAALEPKDPQPAGASWKIGGEDVATALDDGTVPLDASRMGAVVELKSVEGERADYRVALDIALKGLLIGPGKLMPWKRGGSGKVVFKLVRGLAADSLETVIEGEDALDGVCDFSTHELHLAFKRSHTTTITKGGEIPKLAPVK